MVRIIIDDHESIDFENNIKFIRHMEVIGIVMIYVKATYFFSLVDVLAPLMDIIKKIFIDIKDFIFIMCFFITGFATCFYLVGLNQLEFDDITEAEMTKYGVPYSTAHGAIWFVFDNFVLGNTNTYPFNLGLKS